DDNDDDDFTSGRVPLTTVKEEPMSDDALFDRESDRESHRRRQSGLSAAMEQVRVAQATVERQVGPGGHFTLDVLAEAAAAVESDTAADRLIEIVEISSDDEGEGPSTDQVRLSGATPSEEVVGWGHRRPVTG